MLVCRFEAPLTEDDISGTDVKDSFRELCHFLACEIAQSSGHLPIETLPRVQVSGPCYSRIVGNFDYHVNLKSCCIRLQ
jgi:hypothetical protein